MFYRETGQFRTSYAADQSLFPIRLDRHGMAAILVAAFALIPLLGSDSFITTVMIPFLVFALASIGLNLLTGYAGQLSLGTGAFMGVGAYACYKLTTFFPDVNILVLLLLSGFFSAGIGVLFGLPSLRIKGFYLVVATLAAQFFLDWCFNRIGWLYNDNASGAIEVPTRSAFGIALTGPTAAPVARYYALLAIVAAMTWVASNLVRGRIGRAWMMVRDMDIAAELMGVRPLRTKLLASPSRPFIAASPARSWSFCGWVRPKRPASASICRSRCCSWSSSVASAACSAVSWALPSSGCCRCCSARYRSCWGCRSPRHGPSS